MAEQKLLQFQTKDGNTFAIWDNETNQKQIEELRKDKKTKELEPLFEKDGE